MPNAAQTLRLEAIRASIAEHERELSLQELPQLGMLDWMKRFLPQYTGLPFNDMHRWSADRIDKMVIGKQRGCRISVVGSRGTAKSTQWSTALPLRAGCEKTESFIIIVGETWPQAELILEGVKEELEHNQELAEAYPEACGKGSVWRDDQIRMRNGVLIQAVGTGAAIRGRRFRHNRPSLVILDDAQGENAIWSPTQRDKDWVWFTRTVLKLGEDLEQLNVVCLGNALHRDCIVMKLQRTNTWLRSLWPSIRKWPANMGLWAQWEELLHKIPPDDDPEASAREAKKFWEKNRKELERGVQLLWPERESLYSLMTMRATDGHAAFEAEKQCNPVNPEACEWPESYFDDHIWCERMPNAPQVRVVAMDPSKGKDAKNGDYQAIVKLAYGRDRCLYVDVDMDRIDCKLLADKFVETCRQFNVDGCGVETNQFQELLADEIEDKAAELGYPLTVAPLDNRTRKEVRIRRLTPYLAQKRIRFLKRSPGCQLCVQQMKDFPVGDHDDGPDALEMAVRVAIGIFNGKMMNQPTEVDIELG